jgi:hypothetical protein
VYQEKYVYTRDWKDGQIVFMDQEITLHKRPTDVLDGDKRTMARAITYVNHLYPNSPEAAVAQQVRYNGAMYSLDDFAKLIDEDRKHTFETQEGDSYLTVPVIA